MSKIDFEKIAKRFCDGCCKFPHICEDEDELRAKCENCPICKLEEMIDE